MHRFFYLTIFIALLTSCSSTKNYLQQKDGDKALFDALEKLDKNGNSKKAAEALPALYANAQKRHLAKIAEYSTQKDINRWQSILDTYVILQKMYVDIISSLAGGRLVRPVDYQEDIDLTVEAAAEEYYQLGIANLADNSKEGIRKAWRSFKQADKLMPRYKDSKDRMAQISKDALLKIVVLPTKDEASQNNHAIQANNSINNQLVDQVFVSSMGATSATLSDALFYTILQASKSSINPDWTVQLTLSENVSGPSTDSYTYRENKIITTGYDSSRNPITEDVNAQITKYTQRLRITTEIKLDIIDAATGQTIISHKYPEVYNWQNEYATYMGDAMALTNATSTIVNKGGPSTHPDTETIINRLYKKLYPKVKDKILLTINEYQNQ